MPTHTHSCHAHAHTRTPAPHHRSARQERQAPPVLAAWHPRLDFLVFYLGVGTSGCNLQQTSFVPAAYSLFAHQTVNDVVAHRLLSDRAWRGVREDAGVELTAAHSGWARGPRFRFQALRCQGAALCPRLCVRPAHLKAGRALACWPAPARLTGRAARRASGGIER
jgi:hypothetical protein